jgi:hypothetical protein
MAASMTVASDHAVRILQRILAVLKHCSLRFCGRCTKAFPVASDTTLGNFFSLMRPATTGRPLIRIGGDGDGGYLVPDDLQGIVACFSPGVAATVAFETDLADRGIRSFMIDGSIQALPKAHPLFHFEAKFLGVSDAPGYTSLTTWVQDYGSSSGDLILQMDIEGSEYGVLLSTEQTILERFRILIIEFHHLDWVFGQVGVDIGTAVFQRLLATHEIVHIHPNNASWPVRFRDYAAPPTMEFTLLRKDRIVHPGTASTFPHPLDRPNMAWLSDYPLPKVWYDRPE